MKGESDALWEKLPNTLKGDKKDMNANEILSKHGITMKVGTGADEGESRRAPKADNPGTIKDASAKKMPEDSYDKELKGAYAGEMGTGPVKTSKMAQETPKKSGMHHTPRKGY